MSALATTVALLVLTLAVLMRVRVKSRATLWLLLPNFVSTAWAHYLAVAGALAALLGLIAAAPAAVLAGLAGAVLAADSVRAVTESRTVAFDRGLSPGWSTQLTPDAQGRIISRRWGWRVPAAPAAQRTNDLVFATLDGGRKLLCDVWEPQPEASRSRLAVVFLHGSAWYLLDKDVGTRAFFGHLVAQGHVVMDVAYRLCPETDGVGMVADAKRAVAWLKEHARDYGVDPARIVLMGGSAGGHIALLAAYSAGLPALTPPGLRASDTEVAAVVSYYGVTDLRAFDAFARPFLAPGPLVTTPRTPPTEGSARMWRRFFGKDLPEANLPPPPPHAVIMRELAGGLIEEVPDRFDLLSPIHLVRPTCPPTLHFQPEYDHIAPVESGRALHRALTAAGVPSVYVELPLALHAFDLIVPALFSPASQAALQDVERFLAWVAAAAPAREGEPATRSATATAHP